MNAKTRLFVAAAMISKELMRKITRIGLPVVVLLAFAGPALGGKNPDATISLSAGAVATGSGFSWGKGTVTYKGKEYYFSVNGLSVGEFGSQASGEVYQLKQIEDFNGNYTAVRPGIMGRTRSAVTLVNEKGVRVRLSPTSRRTVITIVGGRGVDMKLK